MAVVIIIIIGTFNVSTNYVRDAELLSVTAKKICTSCNSVEQNYPDVAGFSTDTILS
jgi:hypothetical protein